MTPYFEKDGCVMKGREIINEACLARKNAEIDALASRVKTLEGILARSVRLERLLDTARGRLESHDNNVISMTQTIDFLLLEEIDAELEMSIRCEECGGSGLPHEQAFAEVKHCIKCGGNGYIL